MVLAHNTRFLQEVLLYAGTLNHTLLIEVNVDVLAKTARVVIADCLGIAKGCLGGGGGGKHSTILK